MNLKRYLINMHYFRPDGNYEGWNVWYWEHGENTGIQADFSTSNHNYKIASFYIESSDPSQMVGFILRRSSEQSEWAQKDIPFDRFIPLDMANSDNVLNIYIRESEIDFGFNEYYFDCFSSANYGSSINTVISDAINYAINETLIKNMEIFENDTTISESINSLVSSTHKSHHIEENNIEMSEQIYSKLSTSLKKEGVSPSDSSISSKFKIAKTAQPSINDDNKSEISEDYYLQNIDISDKPLYESIKNPDSESTNQVDNLNLLKLSLKTDVFSDEEMIENIDQVSDTSKKTDSVNIFQYLKFKLNKLFNHKQFDEFQFDSNETKSMVKKFLKIFKPTKTDRCTCPNNFGKLNSSNKKVFGFYMNGSAQTDLCNNMVMIFNTDDEDICFKLPSITDTWSILMNGNGEQLESFEGSFITVKANSTAILGDTKGIKVFEKRVIEKSKQLKKERRRSLKRNADVIKSIQQSLNFENTEKLNSDKVVSL